MAHVFLAEVQVLACAGQMLSQMAGGARSRSGPAAEATLADETSRPQYPAQAPACRSVGLNHLSATVICPRQPNALFHFPVFNK